ncbi:hypothetical protein B0H67DRAFT_566439 [Lasiosphaeris hirsuta]|uniref:Rhodopsin domain-containing protein n=1 Tax=Lasiosphaeris hirsuta TaxID=260670 RepID=A0AA40BD05_9PEZI|nr:hypothetical protein B0H67DRAFT_566439 [Lasiosphaeris hirsuta]
MSDADSPPPPPPPPGPPPPGPPPFGDPATLAHNSLKANLYASAVVCWAVAAIFVALRFYTRGVVIRVLGPTDWSILAALIFGAGTSVAIIDQVVHGSGTHIWDLDPTDTPSAIAWFRAAWYGIVFYLLSLCFSKISILLLYIHIFAFKWARLAGQILLGIVIVSSLWMLIATVTACIPLQAYWDFTIAKGYCHPQSVWWSNTGLHMATDFLIFLLPLPVVWTIMLPRRQKFALFGVFGFGFVVCFISILRLLKLYQNDKNPDPDFTWAAVELSYLTAVEVNGAIVCACIMTLKPLVTKLFPGLLGSRGSQNPAGSDNSHRGPPTIGSKPSKAPLSPADSDLLKVDGRPGARRIGTTAWLDAAGGYVEIDEDGWAVDVELAETKGGSLATVKEGPMEDKGTMPAPATDGAKVKDDTGVKTE